MTKMKTFTVAEVAEFMGVLPMTVNSWLQDRWIIPTEEYEVRADDLVTFMMFQGMRVPVELHRYLRRPKHLANPCEGCE